MTSDQTGADSNPSGVSQHFPDMQVGPDTLSRRLLLYPEEPVHAYASRLARYHGLQSLSEFCSRYLSVSITAIRNGKDQAAIEMIAGWPSGVFGAATATRRPGHWQIGPERFRLTDWSHRCLRICPACLRSDYDDDEGIDEDYDYRPHQRTWWNLTAVTACHLHGWRLVPIDPSEIDLARHADLPRATASSAAVLVARLIVGRLGFAARIDEPSYTRGLPLDRLLNVAELIGGLSLSTGRGTSVAGQMTGDDARETGIGILLNGEAAVSETLFGVIRNLAASELPTPGNSFGDLYTWFRTHHGDADILPLQSLFIDHCLDHLLIDHRQGLFKDRASEARQTRLSTAARIVGCELKTLIRLLTVQRDAKATEGLFPATLVPTTSMKMARRIARTVLQPADAARHLGLSAAQFKELVASNVLRPLIEANTGHHSAPWSKFWFEKSRSIFSSLHLDRQVERLLERLPDCTCVSRDHVLLLKAPSLFRSLTLSALISAMQSGDLTASVKRDDEGAAKLPSVVVPLVDVFALESKRQKANDTQAARVERARCSSDARLRTLHKKGMPLLAGGLCSIYPPPSWVKASSETPPRQGSVQLTLDLSSDGRRSPGQSYPMGTLFTLDQLANRWRCDRGEVRALIASGTLEAEVCELRRGRTHRQLVAENTLRGFENSFISLRELDARLANPRHAIIEHLKLRGYLTNLHPTDATFFPRSAALELFSLD